MAVLVPQTCVLFIRTSFESFSIKRLSLNTLRINARGISEEGLLELINKSYRQKGLTHEQICTQLSKDMLKKLPE